MIGQLGAITGRNIKLYLRDRGAVFFSLLSMFIVIGLMVFFLGDMNVDSITGLLGQFPGRDAQQDKENAQLLVLSWTCAGILSINVVTVTLSALAPMIKDKTSGRLNAVYTAPVGRGVLAAGYVLAAWVASVFICTVTLLVTEIYGVSRGMEWFSLFTHCKLCGMIMVNSFAYASFMYTVAALVKSESAWSGLGTVIGTLVGFLGGIYLPIGTLSDTVGAVMKGTPIIYGAAMFRGLMTKDILDTTFLGAPEDMAAAYRETMGIDLYVFDRQVSLEMALLLLLIFGAAFLMIGAVIVQRGKRSDR